MLLRLAILLAILIQSLPLGGTTCCCAIAQGAPPERSCCDTSEPAEPVSCPGCPAAPSRPGRCCEGPAQRVATTAERREETRALNQSSEKPLRLDGRSLATLAIEMRCAARVVRRTPAPPTLAARLSTLCVRTM